MEHHIVLGIKHTRKHERKEERKEERQYLAFWSCDSGHDRVIVCFSHNINQHRLFNFVAKYLSVVRNF
jgi:hypothetical protein